MENRKGGNLSISSSEALTTTLRNAIQALGRGFDVTSDVRLLYCKGAPGSRLVLIEEEQNRDLELSDGFILPNVPADIECSRGRNSIQRIPVCSFRQMAEYFNETSGVKENIPLGCFNAMFNYTGSWQVDAASTKSLALVGYFIPLYEVKLAKLTLFLRDEIRRAVPSSWDPASLARYVPLFDAPCFLQIVSSALAVDNLYINMASKAHNHRMLKYEFMKTNREMI